MHFSDDDLRSALRRRDPGERFTGQVLAKLRTEGAAGLAPRSVWPKRKVLLQKLAVAAVFLVVAGAAAWEGLAQYRRFDRRRAGEAAERQAVLALRMTTAQLNHVFERAQAAERDQSDAGGINETN
jgi:hypothetical protein